MTDPLDVVRLQLTSWLNEWSGYVRARDFTSARQMFDPDVIGFGTHMRLVRGLDNLERDQWRNVWGTIEDFHFLTDQMECGVSNDGLRAWAIVPWSSTGFLEDGSPFDRPGRATVLFARPAVSAPWRSIHTHISLAPGTPHRSWGRR